MGRNRLVVESAGRARNQASRFRATTRARALPGNSASGPLVLAALAAALLWYGCQRTPPPVPTAAGPPAPSVGQLKAEGDELLRQREYAAAVAKYESALQATPDDVSLRFALGSALSYLDRREETVQQFRWVVRHAPSHSKEAQVARQWLTNAGDRSGSPPVVRAAAGEPASRVRGKTEWTGVDPRQRLVPLHVFLEDDANRQVRFARRFRLGEPYEFRDVPPGTYRLIAKVEKTQLWEQTVTVEAGRDTVLDLSPANSPLPVDQLPSSAGEQ
jgi:tetratricopeptide (TPR) repeat protein